MCEICVFAGTTEGRRLVEYLEGQRVRVLACVATDYGVALLPESENVEVSARRLDEEAMAALFRERRFDVVVDATHPYAAKASESIAAACACTGTEYLRLNRSGQDGDEDAVWVDSIRDAADYLAGHPGTALLTTESKELAPYARVENFAERFHVRVLPLASSLAACAEAGFPPSRVIAMQGPFSAELNAALLRSVHADYLVTKDSGDSGGFREKLEAARQAGCQCIVVGRPVQRPGGDFAQVLGALAKRFGLVLRREVAVIGIGLGGRDSMTFEADRALRRCDCIIGAARMLEAVAGYGKPAFCEISPDGIRAAMEAHPEYRRVAVVMSGDAGFFSGAKKLLPRLAEDRVRVIPGISSLQALCARLGTSWEDVKAISLHGREGSVVPALKRCGRVFALLDGTDAVRRVCADLIDAGMGDTRVSVGERLGYPDEAVTRGTAKELADHACAPLSAVLLEHPIPACPLPIGLPDEVFLRQEAGEGRRTVPMTKAEVRAVSLSKLQLTEDAVVWDVGAGTGSVSAEAALLCPAGRVYAVERREDAARFIGQNADRFGLRNLFVVQGEAPEALAELPAPTHAFIGGASGKLRPILDAILAKNPGARVVVNAVSLETLGELAQILREGGFETQELVQLTVAHSRRVGAYTMMNGQNPVWIATIRRGKGGAAHEG